MSNLKFLLSVISCVFDETDFPEPPKNFDWEKFYRFASRQKILSLISYALDKAPPQQVPEKIRAHFLEKRNQYFFVNTLRQIELESLFHELETHQARYMPLKGYFLEKLYPFPDMRHMVDIDILVDAESSALIGTFLRKQGFQIIREGQFYDNIYTKYPGINFEIHRELFEPEHPFVRMNTLAWKNAQQVPGYSFQYEMPRDLFYLFHLLHLAKHYKSSGIDIRFLLDTWLFLRKEEAHLDRDFLNQELEQFQLTEFARNIEQLAFVWFEGRQSNKLIDELSQFIFAGLDMRDIMANRLMDQMNPKQIHGLSDKIRFSLSLLFLSKTSMARRYPLVNKYPFLLPYFWAHHLISCLGRPEARTKILGILCMNKKRMKYLKELNSKFGFK